MDQACVPIVKIRPPGRWEAIDLRAVWKFRGLIRALVVRDLKLRYRQTVLGVVWVVLQPLIGAGILAFIFGRVARLESGGVPYLVLAYCGLLGWNLFSTVVVKTGSSLVGNAALVSKVAFPRLVLPFSSALSGLVDFAVGAVAGAIVLIVYRQEPSMMIVTAPFWVLSILLLATGVGLICAALAVAYRDVMHVLPVAMQLLLYASPVGYSVSAIPEGAARSLYLLNPLASLLEGFRHSVLGSPLPNGGPVVYSLGMALVVFVIGLLVFRARERHFADVI